MALAPCCHRIAIESGYNPAVRCNISAPLGGRSELGNLSTCPPGQRLQSVCLHCELLAGSRRYWRAVRARQQCGAEGCAAVLERRRYVVAELVCKCVPFATVQEREQFLQGFRCTRAQRGAEQVAHACRCLRHPSIADAILTPTYRQGARQSMHALFRGHNVVCRAPTGQARHAPSTGPHDRPRARGATPRFQVAVQQRGSHKCYIHVCVAPCSWRARG